MLELIEHEKFEIEIIETLHRKQVIPKLIFCGGTMLRLCYGMNRYSVDLDFWIKQKQDVPFLYEQLKTLGNDYDLRDIQNKHYTLIAEIKSERCKRSLKIEIRKEVKDVAVEQTIAFSPHTTKQVLVDVVSLQDMMNEKINAFLDRKEIRDAFDMEFLIKRGIRPKADKEKLQKLLKEINHLTDKDYKVKLGSLLNEPDRAYYNQNKFKLLESFLNDVLSRS